MLTITLFHGSANSRPYGVVVNQVLQRAARAVSSQGAVAVNFISDQKMRKLNRTYRGKDTTTNVLSFGTETITDDGRRTTEQHDLGDIFISLSVAKKEAKQYRWTMHYAIARLALHGFLHLLGYDHVKDNDAEVMEGIEKRLLKNI